MIIMLIYILEYILGYIEKFSFNVLVNCIFNIQIFKLEDSMLIPLSEAFDIEVVDACDINVESLCGNIKWNDKAINNLSNSDIIFVAFGLRSKIHIKWYNTNNYYFYNGPYQI